MCGRVKEGWEVHKLPSLISFFQCFVLSFLSGKSLSHIIILEHEFRKMLGFHPHMKPATSSMEGAVIPDIEVPVSFDWREQGVVTPVKNQVSLKVPLNLNIFPEVVYV